MKVPLGAFIAVCAIAILGMLGLWSRQTFGVPYMRDSMYAAYIETDDGIQKGIIYFNGDVSVGVVTTDDKEIVHVRILERMKQDGK